MTTTRDLCDEHREEADLPTSDHRARKAAERARMLTHRQFVVSQRSAGESITHRNLRPLRHENHRERAVFGSGAGCRSGRVADVYGTARTGSVSEGGGESEGRARTGSVSEGGTARTGNVSEGSDGE